MLQPMLQPGVQYVPAATLQRPVQVQAVNPAQAVPIQSATLPAKKSSAKHIPLARCRALYLGSAVPLETSQGLEAVQGPCRERYPFESAFRLIGIEKRNT